MKRLRPIMFVGTGSDVGKSLLVTGVCRVFKQFGYTPAPFKAQNMSLNSYATPDGLEIGRAQAVQAEACGIPCSTTMNPILLKPSSKHSSQVILHGKPIGDQTAKAYFLGNNKEELFTEAKKAFQELSKTYNPIILEGAGSISELNLKHHDIVNMRMAQAAEANVYLIADIDKGGVFASVYGSIALLEPWEKALIKGIIINKFRGDTELFLDGKERIEKLTGLPVIGIIPYAKDIYIEEEDSLGLEKKNFNITDGLVNIAVLLLPYLSNYTDFNVLERDSRVHLYYTNTVEELEQADIIIIPGSKNTIEDLQFLRKQGLAKAIITAHDNGKQVIGICGGYQMLGTVIEDPHGIESNIKKLPGLGIIPATTVLTKEKTTVQQTFNFKDYVNVCTGYEIHMGETVLEHSSPLNKKENNTEGYFKENCWGTYMHGILDNPIVVNDLLQSFGKAKKIDFDYQVYKEENYNKLADLLKVHLDFDAILTEMTL